MCTMGYKQLVLLVSLVACSGQAMEKFASWEREYLDEQIGEYLEAQELKVRSEPKAIGGLTLEKLSIFESALKNGKEVDAIETDGGSIKKSDFQELYKKTECCPHPITLFVTQTQLLPFVLLHKEQLYYIIPKESLSMMQPSKLSYEQKKTLLLFTFLQALIRDRDTLAEQPTHDKQLRLLIRNYRTAFKEYCSYTKITPEQLAFDLHSFFRFQRKVMKKTFRQLLANYGHMNKIGNYGAFLDRYSDALDKSSQYKSAVIDATRERLAKIIESYEQQCRGNNEQIFKMLMKDKLCVMLFFQLIAPALPTMPAMRIFTSQILNEFQEK